jgi:hypothetical protein
MSIGKCFQSADEALSFLKEALEEEPILIGPVDMGFLVYDPYCKFKKGADHYVIALGIDEDHIILNDPDGYLQVPLPISNFLKAWKAEAIAYKKGPYSLWLVKEKLGTPPVEKLYKDTLVLGLQNLKEKGRKYSIGGSSLYTGPLAKACRRY